MHASTTTACTGQWGGPCQDRGLRFYAVIPRNSAPGLSNDRGVPSEADCPPQWTLRSGIPVRFAPEFISAPGEPLGIYSTVPNHAPEARLRASVSKAPWHCVLPAAILAGASQPPADL